MSNNKFKFVTSTMFNQVEEDYIQFVGDNHQLKSEEFIKAFKAKLNSQSKVNRIHAEILKYRPNYIILQTSQFNPVAQEYKDHYLWVFTKTGEGKYNWSLNRYRALPQ